MSEKNISVCVSGGLPVWETMGRRNASPNQYYTPNPGHHKRLCIPQGTWQRQLWKGKDTYHTFLYVF